MKKIITILALLLTATTLSSVTSTQTSFASSKTVVINEIFPNPKGKDAGNEWLELYNQTETDIDLINWEITNNKKHKIQKSTIIKAKSYLTLENPKITLRNKTEEISLISPNKEEIDKIKYENALENKSFSRITETEWKWVSPTKNSKNPTYTTFTGKISKEPEISKDFHFEFAKIKNNKESKPIKIIFLSEDYDFELLKTLFKKDTELKVTVEKSNNNYILKDYKITNTPETAAEENKKTSSLSWEFWLLPILLPATTWLAYTVLTAKDHASPSHYKSTQKTPPS